MNHEDSRDLAKNWVDPFCDCGFDRKCQGLSCGGRSAEKQFRSGCTRQVTLHESCRPVTKVTISIMQYSIMSTPG